MVVFQGREAPCGTVGICTETHTHKHHAVRLSRSTSHTDCTRSNYERPCMCVCGHISARGGERGKVGEFRMAKRLRIETMQCVAQSDGSYCTLHR